MGWYANLKIGRKLLLGFAAVIAISVIIGLAGIWGMGNIDETMSDINDTILTQVVFANEAYINLIQHNRRLYRHIVAADAETMQQSEAQIHLNEVAIRDVFARHGKTRIPEAEAVIIARFERLWPEYAALASGVLKLSASGEKKEALKIAEGEERILFKKLDDILSELVRFNVMEAKAEQASARDLYHSIRYWLGGMILCAFLIGIVMASFITRSVVSPVRTVLDAIKTLVEGGEEKARLAEAIASGDLDQRVIVSERLDVDTGSVAQDEAGTLLKAVVGMSEVQRTVDMAFARMTDALRRTRSEERERDWLKSGTSELGGYLRGDCRLDEMLDRSLEFLCEYLGAGVGAFYLNNEKADCLELMATYAASGTTPPAARVALGEGLAGQAARERKTVCLADVPSHYLPISSSLGEAQPLAIAAVPLVHESRLVGVIELGSFTPFGSSEMAFIEQIREGLAVGISVNIARKVIDELLEQTQAQTEELRVQQEELQQTNEELEERAQMLEQQREQIRAKNREAEQASLEIKRKAEELERVSTYKSEFLANMSHELRTPLNSLMILSSLLRENRDGNLTVKQVEYAATINSAGTDLLNLINDILDLSKIESGRMEYNYEPLPLRGLFEQVRTMFKPVAEQRGLAFDLSIEGGMPEEIVTDSHRLQQILKNLISNACKFTQQGGVTLRAYIPAVTENPLSLPAIAFSVQDTGIGIPSVKHELVFQAFQQADGTTSRKFGGTGLGLSISRQLARGLHGDIRLEGEEGKGCTFTLYLPLNGADLKIEAAKAIQAETSIMARSAEIPSVSQEDDIPPAPLPDDRENIKPGGKSILIVEDDLSFAGILVDMVRKRGFAAIVAADGETGILLADRFLPSAVILDVMLPHIDGWGVMRSLKDNMKTRHIPVHFLTCMEDRQKAMSMGAIGFLTKPVDSEQLNQLFGTIEESVSRTVRKLLIVEDNRDEAKSMAALLGERDVDITIAETGTEAIELLISELFDCVVLDLGLSDISGFEVLEKMQKLDEPLRPPVIIHSGRELTHEEEVKLRHYAESIIIKGAKSPERLLNEVTLFLHVVESGIHPDKQRMIRKSLDSEVMLEGKKVLIVDDDMRNIFSLSSVLAEKSMQVIEAENGREGLARLDEQPDVDIVLMDIMMPEMDGYTAIKNIRKDPRFAKLPIIALTAKAMKGDRDECLKAGASDYIPKPVDVDKLFSLLRVWLYGNS